MSLSAPAGVTAIGSADDVVISWNAVIGASSYNLYRSDRASGPFTLFMQLGDATSYLDASLNAGQTKHYSVRAVDATGVSPPSANAFATRLAAATALVGIFVSSPTGADTNAGTQAAPLKSIGYAISKRPKQIFLKRGDRWSEDIIAFDGMKLDAYGTGNKPQTTGRIKIGRRGGPGNVGVNVSNVQIKNVITIAPPNVNRSSTTEGIICCGDSNLLEGVESIGWPYGIQLASKSVVDGGGVRCANNELRACLFKNCWGYSKSQGAYATHQDGLKFTQGCRFENCGWKNSAFTSADDKIHGFYGSESNGPVFSDGTLIKHCGNFGWQCRSGGAFINGRIEDCNNAIKMGDNDSRIENVVILRCHNITTGNAGWGIFAMRVKNLAIKNVFIGNKGTGNPGGEAIKIENWSDPYIPSNVWSIQNARNHVVAASQNVTLENVIVYEWRSKYLVRVPQLAPSSSLTISNSKLFQQDASYTGAFALNVQVSGTMSVTNTEVAIARNPNSLKNGAACEMGTRVPFASLPQP